MSEIIDNNRSLKIIYLTNFESPRIVKAFVSNMGITAKIYNASNEPILRDITKNEDILFSYVQQDWTLKDIYIVQKENKTGIMQYLELINNKYAL